MNVGLLDKYKELTDSKTWSSRSVDPGKESTVLHNLDAVTSNKLIQLVWEGISNQIKNENENLTILENINGFANPGELTIIMGSSGAGKTSLLNIIAGRALQNTKHIVTGSVKANGIPIDQINYKKFSAFITQEDMLLPYLTVRETFLYAAKLKIDGTNQDIEEKVDKLIYELRLANIADNLIGNVILKGISGGEKKRVSIGVELISDPQIIILDEPTSGLDSFTADMVIDILHRQTRIGKTVLLTVHQPSSSIYRKFDTLILLSEGQMMYHGQSKKSRKYFNELGYKCPNMVNPPDYYMKLLFISNRYLKTDSEKQTLKVLTEQFNKNPPKAVLNKNWNLANLNTVDIPHVNYWKKASILIDRAFLNKRRDPSPVKVNVGFTIIICILVDLIFARLGNDYDDIQNIVGVLFYISIHFIMIGNGGAAIEFPSERSNFLRENSQGLYNSSTYYLAKLISEFPFQILLVTVSSVLFYYPLGLNETFTKFLVFYLVCLLSLWIGIGLGYCTGLMCPNEQIASMTAPMIVAPLASFGGMFASVKSMNKSFSWIQYICPFMWSFKSLAINEFNGLYLTCDDCDPLDELGFYGSVWTSIRYMILYAVVIRIAAFGLLKYVRYKF